MSTFFTSNVPAYASRFQVIEIKYFFVLVRNLLGSIQAGLQCTLKNYPEFSMPSRYSVPKLGALGVSLALASLLAQAAPTTYFATQAPKADLSNPTPPVLNVGMSTQLNAFNTAIAALGRNEFESGSDAGPGTFSYAGGVATLTGGSVVGVMQSSPTLGRYNMSTGLPPDPDTAGTGTGHWLEGSSNFSYAFSSAITALSFYGTDFGDLNGSFELQLYSGASMIYSTTSISNNGANDGNGNLLFYGVTSDVAFDRAVFKITQAVGSTTLDVLGFDSFVVGNANVSSGGTAPEPTSLALAGLALAAAGFAARRTRRA